MELGAFLSELRAAGVKRFEIELDPTLRDSSGVEQHAVNVSVGGSNPSLAANPSQPQDLPGANEQMSYDQIRDWSASPDPLAPETEAILGTGDAPLIAEGP